MEEFQQGYRLASGDLNTEFWSQLVAWSFELPRRFSPYWIRYGLGYIKPDNKTYHEFGSRYRFPDELFTGIFRPNFIIGGDWPVGEYEVRWKYRVWADSDIEFRKVRFLIVTAGVYNQPVDLNDWFDLPAQMVVVP